MAGKKRVRNRKQKTNLRGNTTHSVNSKRTSLQKLHKDNWDNGISDNKTESTISYLHLAQIFLIVVTSGLYTGGITTHTCFSYLLMLI